MTNEQDRTTPRPRRQREVPNYPENPITIPAERIDASTRLLGETYELWEQDQHLRALLTWFGAPKQVRDDAIDNTLLNGNPEGSLRDSQYDSEGQPTNLVFRHYALLSADAVRKLLYPAETEPITSEDLRELSTDTAESYSPNNLLNRVQSLGLGIGAYFHDADDFRRADQDIQGNFSLEESRQLLVGLIPHLDDEAKHDLLSSFSLVRAIKHADLLTDPRLADDLEKPLLGEIIWSQHVLNFISQNVFPSANFFEEAFKRLKPEDSSPEAVFTESVKSTFDTNTPASTFYFIMLRGIIQSEGRANPEYGSGQEEKVISYLLSDAFMEHAIPYLDTEEAVRDDYIYSDGGILFHNADPLAKGDEAKTLKRQQLGEVIKAAIDYAHSMGDEETVQKLTQREVAGIRFADLINL